MSGTELGLAVSVFLACTVEAVEAFTIVLAVGTTRSWSSALAGSGAAAVVLTVIVAALGPAIVALPIDALRVLVGGLLLVFGLQWLRKAILRRAGLKALHDETETFAHETQAARSLGASAGSLDGYAFTVAFKGVLLEGLEVVFIVLTFGANQHRIGLAVASAAIAVTLVAAVGLAARAPLARVPENAMKLAVGVMLTSFGVFWSAEGAGAGLPGGDGALLVLIPGVWLAALLMAWALAGRAARTHAGAAGAYREEPVPRVSRNPFARALLIGWDFVVGDDPRTAVGVVLALAFVALLAAGGIAAWWLMPAAALGLLAASLWSEARRRKGPRMGFPDGDPAHRERRARRWRVTLRG